MRNRVAEAWTDRLPEDVLDLLSDRQERKLDRLAEKGKDEKLLAKFEKMLDRLGIDFDPESLGDDGATLARGGKKGGGTTDGGTTDGGTTDAGSTKGKGGGKKGGDGGTDPGTDPGTDRGPTTPRTPRGSIPATSRARATWA